MDVPPIRAPSQRRMTHRRQNLRVIEQAPALRAYSNRKRAPRRRRSDSLDLTAAEAGKEFTALAERLLADLKISIESIRDLAGRPRGQIIVTSVLSLANAVLPTLIADYNRRFPGIEIHLREGFYSAVRDEVRSGVA